MPHAAVRSSDPAPGPVWPAPLHSLIPDFVGHTGAAGSAVKSECMNTYSVEHRHTILCCIIQCNIPP